MSAPFIIPFNFQPASAPSLKTSSYTIPTGRYAQVFDIYGDTSFNGNLNSSIIVSDTDTNGTFGADTTYTYQVPSDASYLNIAWSIVNGGANATIQFLTPSTASGILTGTTVTLFFGSGNSSGNYKTKHIGTGALIAVRSVPNNNSCIATHTVQFYAKNSSIMWVPPGTVISGSSYSVTEFNVIS